MDSRRPLKSYMKFYVAVAAGQTGTPVPQLTPADREGWVPEQ